MIMPEHAEQYRNMEDPVLADMQQLFLQAQEMQELSEPQQGTVNRVLQRLKVLHTASAGEQSDDDRIAQ